MHLHIWIIADTGLDFSVAYLFYIFRHLLVIIQLFNALVVESDIASYS